MAIGHAVATKRRLVLLLLAFVTMVCIAAPAWADDTSASGDSGASQAADEEMLEQMGNGSIDVSDVILSAEDDAALIEECSFALGDFKRAQTGTSALINDAFYGYHFLVGSDPTKISLIAAKGFVVVYVPQDVISDLGIDLDDEDIQDALKRYLYALDTLNAHGGDVIADSDVWYFTDESEFNLDGVVFSFNQELKEGFFYDCALGEDGGDVTAQHSPYHTTFTHACYATMMPSDQVSIAAEPTFTESVQRFFAKVNFSPLWVTLKTTLCAIVIVFILGLLAAYFSLKISPRAQDIADSIFTIPMVLPPTVCGFLLLLLLGKRTFIGQWFAAIGFPLVFSWPATVIAAVVVSFPLMYRSARGAFESLDPNMLDAARTLGWGNWRIFFKLMLPLSWSNIAAGTVLAFARALGEFGATLFLAGNYLGITRTIPIAIYFEWMNGNTDVALFWTALIMIFSFVIILFINLWSRHTTRYRKGTIKDES